jgi:hypothetical protein
MCCRSGFPPVSLARKLVSMVMSEAKMIHAAGAILLCVAAIRLVQISGVMPPMMPAAML